MGGGGGPRDLRSFRGSHLGPKRGDAAPCCADAETEAQTAPRGGAGGAPASPPAARVPAALVLGTHPPVKLKAFPFQADGRRRSGEGVRKCGDRASLGTCQPTPGGGAAGWGAPLSSPAHPHLPVQVEESPPPLSLLSGARSPRC